MWAQPLSWCALLTANLQFVSRLALSSTDLCCEDCRDDFEDGSPKRQCLLYLMQLSRPLFFQTLSFNYVSQFSGTLYHNWQLTLEKRCAPGNDWNSVNSVQTSIFDRTTASHSYSAKRSRHSTSLSKSNNTTATIHIHHLQQTHWSWFYVFRSVDTRTSWTENLNWDVVQISASIPRLVLHIVSS